MKAMGLGSEKEAVTEAHLQAADETIAQLTQAKADADAKAALAETALATANEEKTKAATALAEEKQKVATLEEWKKNQAAVDGREEDDSNSLDGETEALAPWEQAAASAIATAKKRTGTN